MIATVSSERHDGDRDDARRLLANVFHTARPRINPSGTPTMTPTRANVVACQETVETT